ncbi:hypothetical protein BJ170DRAFT_174071 [Xylariales sp. AK1849]|nr:hypothetical protein BJ170DRAFT_174071 [Xylariales sp. AK1849]
MPPRFLQQRHTVLLTKMATRNHHICCIVPPYLLSGIAESSENDAPLRESAQRAITLSTTCHSKRQQRFAALSVPRGTRHAEAQAESRRGIVPDSMLKHISESQDVDEETRTHAKRDLEHIQNVHQKYQQSQAGASGQNTLAASSKGSSTKTYRAVYDAQNDENEADLPGKVIRVEGQKAAKDTAVNEAYDNVGHVLDFYASIFNWKSIDNKNMHVISSVHYAKNYENAFWDPEIAQMVFGDGYTFIHNFTGCIDVIGHELTHAVTEHTSPLDYSGQPGALNEHVSDAFGIMIKQKAVYSPTLRAWRSVA